MRYLVSLVGCIAGLCNGSSVWAQSAEYYRGTVVNGEFRDQPANLEFSIYQQTDSGTLGWLQVGPPLGGSGFASVILADLDSLYLVSVSLTGDTIVWASATRIGTIGGRYWIRGGQYSGQGGTWRLEPRRRLSLATLILSALFAAGAAMIVIYSVAVYSCDRWWRWQHARPILGATEAQLRSWRSIGGWLSWIVVTHSILVLYLAAQVKEIGESLGPTWMLAAALPALRPVLFIESAAHVLQILGVSLGLLLIFRRSSMAPPYWIGLLVAVAGVAIYDLTASQSVLPNISQVFGAEAGSELMRQAQTENTRNMRAVLSSAIWSLYWIRSRRVRVTFSPSGETRGSPEVASALSHVNEDAGSEPSQPTQPQGEWPQ